MTFSLDLTKPLSRVGFLVNLVFLSIVFSGLSWLSFGYMTHTLPHGAILAEEQAIAQKAQDQAFTKAKAAAKGKAFDEKAALAEAKKAGLEAAEKKHEEIHHHAVGGWAPFAVFLLIISAIFFAGFLSIALQRRANEAAKNGLLVFIAHVGAWALATFIAFEPFLSHHGLTKAWSVVGILGLVLMLPIAFAGEGQNDEHGH
jgi:hypothetical protein